MEYIEGNIKCPYFEYVKPCKIKCEAPNDDGKILCLEFRNNQKRNEYIDNFCSCGCWRGCAVAEIIAKK